MSLNENITKFRTKRGETQSQLADILGVSNRTVSKWECGDGDPDILTLMKLAEHYNVSLDDLCGFEPAKTDAPPSPETVIAEAFRKLYRTTRELRDNLGLVRKECPEAGMTPPPYVLEQAGKPYETIATGLYTDGVWSHFVNSHENNLAVTLLRNDENFAWLRDRADDLTTVFAWLTDTDILKFLYLTLSKALPHGFTAEYVAETYGIPAEKARGFLEFAGSISHEAELLDGTVTVYEGIDPIFSGMWLATLSLGYELLRDEYSFSGYWKGNYHPLVPENEQ